MMQPFIRNYTGVMQALVIYLAIISHALAIDNVLIFNNFAKDNSLHDKVLTHGAIHYLHAKNKFDCLSKCGQEERCLVVSYNAGERWCRLYEDGTGVSSAASGWRSWRALCCTGPPPPIPDGVVSFRSIRAGSTAHYICLSGFTFVGTSLESLCTMDRAWEGFGGSCEAVTDCKDIKGLNPAAASGVYSILSTVGSDPISVYCDMTDDGGGWTVIQKRTHGPEMFLKCWTDYKNGFGSLYSEFWLGNTHLWRITTQRNYTLKVELEDWGGDWRYATYSRFAVSGESDDFRLDVGGYDGNAGDSFSANDNVRFSTYDIDNDNMLGSNCAACLSGGWWYTSCGQSSLNGKYNVWLSFIDYWSTLKYTSMKIRP